MSKKRLLAIVGILLIVDTVNVKALLDSKKVRFYTYPNQYVIYIERPKALR